MLGQPSQFVASIPVERGRAGPSMIDRDDKPRYFSVRIERDADEVYRFITDASKLGRWAQGLRSAVWEPARTAVEESSAGPIEMCFTEQSEFGVCDLSITTPRDGQVIECPIRASPSSRSPPASTSTQTRAMIAATVRQAARGPGARRRHG
jgi:hypothetical protein